MNQQNFDIISFISKKKNKLALAENEINQFIDLVKQKQIPDYQITAWLMAVCVNGMNDDETYYLTKAILNSGQIFQLIKSNKLIIDKHSTGGIGDKVSLILLPILVACGLKVAKLSGKGLGYTGGTIDKLNSLNVKTDLTFNKALELLEKNNIFIIEQTDQIAPVDKILYALRDVTATIDSIPLIAASIMAKKLALKTDYLFLDVKYGSGSFCLTKNDAILLASVLDKIAIKFNINMHINITSMQQPLGYSVGNLIEFNEVHDFLNNQFVCSDLKKLILTFATEILVITKTVLNPKLALKKINTVLETKSAFNVLTKWFESVNANVKDWTNKSFFKPKYIHKIYAPKAGFFNILKNDAVGILARKLGAGRYHKNDLIDFHAGIWFYKKINDQVDLNELLITLYSNSQITTDLVNEAKSFFSLDLEPTKLLKLIEPYYGNQ